jgi:hypothetical protein
MVEDDYDWHFFSFKFLQDNLSCVWSQWSVFLIIQFTPSCREKIKYFEFTCEKLKFVNFLAHPFSPRPSCAHCSSPQIYIINLISYIPIFFLHLMPLCCSYLVLIAFALCFNEHNFFVVVSFHVVCVRSCLFLSSLYFFWLTRKGATLFSFTCVIIEKNPCVAHALMYMLFSW